MFARPRKKWKKRKLLPMERTITVCGPLSPKFLQRMRALGIKLKIGGSLGEKA